MLLLFGIPIYVWMKWRQTPRPAELKPDFDRHLFRRTSAPEPVPHDDVETRVPAGVS